MFAMPQLRLIFLSLFISSVLLPMEDANIKSTKPLRRNVRVARQSGASCGYHSVLNSIVSVQDIENQADEIIRTQFAQKNGSWRAFIIKMRKEKLVKYYIKNLLHRYMPRNTNQQLRTLNNDEIRALDRIANAYAKAFVLDETLNILKKNPKNLEGQLQEIVKRDHSKIENKEILAISQCIQMIDFTKLSITIAHAHQLIEQARTSAKETKLETDLFGDNLNTEEMEALKDFALKKYGVTDDYITIIDETNALKNEAYKEKLNPAKKQMFRKDCIHSFCIRTSDKSAYNQQDIDRLISIINNEKATPEEKDAATKEQTEINRKLSANTESTHWISVTLDRKNGQNTYLIKNSTNANYTNHSNVSQLIEALGQPEAYWEDCLSDEDEIHPHYNNPTESSSSNSKDEQKKYTKKNSTHSTEESKSTNTQNTNTNQTYRVPQGPPSIQLANEPIDFDSIYKNANTKPSESDSYQPKGRYSDPNEINFNYQQFIETAPELVKLKIFGFKEDPEEALMNSFFKRLLLYGEPGNGKTSLAKAIGLAIFKKYYYIPTSSVLDSYKNCHKNLLTEINPLIEKGEPIAIIWDEMNCVTDQHKNHNSSDEIMPTAFSLLLDYCEEKAPFLFMIGTTNNHPDDFPEKIQSRFDEHDDRVFIPCPDLSIRRQIMTDRFKNKKSTLTDDDKNILLEKLAGRSCRNIVKVLDKAIAYSLRADKIITRELVDLSIEKSPLKTSKYLRIAQKHNRTEDEIKTMEADNILIEQNRGVIDQIQKEDQIKLQKEGLEQSATHHAENKQQHQEDVDRQNKNAAYQAFSNLKMKSRDRSAQGNFGIGGGGLSAGISGTQHIVIDSDYEAAKNSLPEEQKEFFKEAQAGFTAAEEAQAQQNQAVGSLGGAIGGATMALGGTGVAVGGTGAFCLHAGVYVAGTVLSGVSVFPATPLIISAGVGIVGVGIAAKGAKKTYDNCTIQ